MQGSQFLLPRRRRGEQQDTTAVGAAIAVTTVQDVVNREYAVKLEVAHTSDSGCDEHPAELHPVQPAFSSLHFGLLLALLG